MYVKIKLTYFSYFPTDTYEQGVERLNILKVQEFACTTGPEFEAEEKIRKLEDEIKGTHCFMDITDVPKLSETNFKSSVLPVPGPLAVKGNCFFFFFVSIC